MSRAESVQEAIERALATGERQRLSDEARDRFMADYRAQITPIIDLHRARQRMATQDLRASRGRGE